MNVNEEPKEVKNPSSLPTSDELTMTYHNNLEHWRQLLSVGKPVSDMSMKELKRQVISLKNILIGIAEAPVEKTIHTTEAETNLIDYYFKNIKQPYVVLNLQLLSEEQKQGAENG